MRWGSDPWGLTPLAVLAAALVLLTGGCGGDADVPPLPEGRFIAVSQSLTPEVQLFAEPVLARVEILVDGDRFDPDRVRVAPFFEPFELDGEVAHTRRDQGRYTHLSYEFTLRCLVWECLPHTDDPDATPVSVGGGVVRPPGEVRDRKTHKLKAARILYDDPQEGTQRVRNVTWPQVASVSRLNFSDRDVSVLGFPFEASVTPLPEASYRLPPALFGIGLLVAALALLALPATLVARTLRRKPPPPVAEPEEPELAPLERALLLVEWTRDGAAEERREALEVLAGELDIDERTELADEARRLAWSRASPTPDAIGELLQSVRGSE
ncbi:MAG: hypothetical protein H0U08_02015 [Actinobacteria bacterium]|nr:hypothetical protein [Actinomycetota bacterium]